MTEVEAYLNAFEILAELTNQDDAEVSEAVMRMHEQIVRILSQQPFDECVEQSSRFDKLIDRITEAGQHSILTEEKVGQWKQLYSTRVRNRSEIDPATTNIENSATVCVNRQPKGTRSKNPQSNGYRLLAKTERLIDRTGC